MAWATEPLNVWSEDAFWHHVHSVIEFERMSEKPDPKGPTDQEMVDAYLMAWISMSLPAGNA